VTALPQKAAAAALQDTMPAHLLQDTMLVISVLGRAMFWVVSFVVCFQHQQAHPSACMLAFVFPALVADKISGLSVFV
jgi:hypothetical protein